MKAISIPRKQLQLIIEKSLTRLAREIKPASDKQSQWLPQRLADPALKITTTTVIEGGDRFFLAIPGDFEGMGKVIPFIDARFKKGEVRWVREFIGQSPRGGRDDCKPRYTFTCLSCVPKRLNDSGVNPELLALNSSLSRHSVKKQNPWVWVIEFNLEEIPF